MTRQTQELLEAALRLPLDERALVAAELLASMDSHEDQARVDRAWTVEIDSRMARAKAGAGKFSDLDDVERRLRKKHFAG
jgi:putative addiction module component (TIGR02574 family)